MTAEETPRHKAGVIKRERQRVARHREDGTPDPAKLSAKRHAELHKPGGPVEPEPRTLAENVVDLVTRGRR